MDTPQRTKRSAGEVGGEKAPHLNDRLKDVSRAASQSMDNPQRTKQSAGGVGGEKASHLNERLKDVNPYLGKQIILQYLCY